MDVAIKELKQRIVAIAANVRGYQERVDRFRQSRMFQNNQREFCKELNQEGEIWDDDQPDTEQSKKFWGDISSELVDHNRDAKRLEDWQSKVNVTKQEKADITKKIRRRFLSECQIGRHEVHT